MKEVVPDFQLGQVIGGVNDAGDEINIQWLGRTHEFPVTEEIATALNMDARTVGRTITARAVRNTSGGDLFPGDLSVTDPAGGIDGLGKVTGASAANDRQAYVNDPMMPSTGVPDKGIFYVITEGPVPVNFAAATAVTAGDVIKAGASGKAAIAATGTDHALLMGTLLETNASTDKALVDVHLEWN